VTVSEGTLLLAAQKGLQRAFRRAERSAHYDPGLAIYVASDTDAFAYAGGASTIIQRKGMASNILAGRFGPELAVMTDAAARKGLDQVIAADDPLALAVGAAYTDNLLIGEELFVARAYLEGKMSQLASLQTQDILRTLAAAGILGIAIYQLVMSL
jgi:hypothetical protein